ncbi:FMN-binding negative transcriptional regulator [Henriciella sp.]|uniref:FMN-binding negative transcriptional regulator n=1 Tax=Henriciella sp. TaxID=1968823 RepID=UPI0026050441|nr:FMN-binding negative transcriptional regulator [Henriciella sp.]
MSDPFEAVSTLDAVRFAAEYPLAWIVPVADPAAALLMPVLFEREGNDPGAMLLGHLPRRAAATGILRGDGRAVFLFLGPNAYIPPAWVSQQGWAPTWNFLSLKATAETTVIDDAMTRPAVETLVEHMEQRDGSGWMVAKIGERYETLLQGIIGFRSKVSGIHPRFKTGQDETASVRDEIRRGLEGHPLTRWME